MPQIELVSVPMNNPHWLGIRAPMNNPHWLGKGKGGGGGGGGVDNSISNQSLNKLYQANRSVKIISWT